MFFSLIIYFFINLKVLYNFAGFFHLNFLIHTRSCVLFNSQSSVFFCLGLIDRGIF